MTELKETTAPANLTDEDLRQKLRTAKAQAFVSRFHREILEEIEFEANRRGIAAE